MENKNNKNNKTPYQGSRRAIPTLTAPDLWDRIIPRLPILAADAAFVSRLRAEGALRDPDPSPLLLEYLRFAYLAWTDPAGATPSVAVDEAWHVHILFTRSYAAFCAATRGDMLHHDPGGGVAGDGARFAEAYRRTLARYEAEFGPPPTRFWPRPAEPPGRPSPGPEPAPAIPKRPPTPDRSVTLHSLPFSVTALVLVSCATFALTQSAALAAFAGLGFGFLALLLTRGPDAPATRRPPPPRRTTRTDAPSSRRDRGRAGETSSGDAGYPSYLMDAGSPSGGHGSHGHGSHGDGGHGGGDGGGAGGGDGGGGGSSCGSSCGGGGCGGG